VSEPSSRQQRLAAAANISIAFLVIVLVFAILRPVLSHHFRGLASYRLGGFVLAAAAAVA
jgi:hypothetical protein